MFSRHDSRHLKVYKCQTSRRRRRRRAHLDLPIGNWSDPRDYPLGAELYSAGLDGKWIVFGRQENGNMDNTPLGVGPTRKK